MALVSLCRRALMKLARWDERDLLKWLIVRLARPLADPSTEVEINDIDRLFQYTFPEPDDVGIAVQSSSGPQIIGERSDQHATAFSCEIGSSEVFGKSCSRLLVLWGTDATQTGYRHGDSGIAKLADVTSDYLIVSVPIYPENLFCPSLPSPFERISWWDSQAAAVGLNTVESPRERFQGLYPRCYRKETEVDSRPTFVQNPRILFAMPERAGAFRWVAEDLVLTCESKAFNCKMSVWQDRQR